MVLPALDICIMAKLYQCITFLLRDIRATLSSKRCIFKTEINIPVIFHELINHDINVIGAPFFNRELKSSTIANVEDFISRFRKTRSCCITHVIITSDVGISFRFYDNFTSSTIVILCACANKARKFGLIDNSKNDSFLITTTSVT